MRVQSALSYRYFGFETLRWDVMPGNVNPESLILSTPWVAKWRPQFIGTLLFLRREDQVLLIHKKTGHGAGRINAPGGKLDPGEGVVAGACREVAEEVGLRVVDARVGIEMRFVERNGPQWLGFALTATEFTGELQETREAKPFWCRVQDIPYRDMWPDDAIWLPRLLQEEPGGPLVANFLFENERLLEYRFVECDSIWQSF
jgi:8-oxo-dGTP diphosphatase